MTRGRREELDVALCLHELLDVGAAERQIPEMATVTYGTAWNKERTLPAFARDSVLALASRRQAGAKVVIAPNLLFPLGRP